MIHESPPEMATSSNKKIKKPKLRYFKNNSPSNKILSPIE